MSILVELLIIGPQSSTEKTARLFGSDLNSYAHIKVCKECE